MGALRAGSIRTLVLDPSDAVLEALVDLLSELEPIALVGVCSTVDEAAALAAAVRPQLALVDAVLASDGRAAARRICDASPETSVIAMARRCSRLRAEELRRAGAISCVEKMRLGEQLPRALAELLPTPAGDLPRLD